MSDDNETNDNETLTDDALILFGGAVKALGDGRIGGYLVRFTNADEPDIQGDYFDASTDFQEREPWETPVYLNHRQPLRTRDGKSIVVKEPIGAATLSVDEQGVLIDAILYNRELYEKALDRMGWSSGSAPHLIDRKQVGKAWHITHWPLGFDASLSPIPADPVNKATPLKAWAAATKNASLEVRSQEGVGESHKTSSTSTTAEDGVTVNVTVVNQKPEEGAKSTEAITMSDNTKDTVPADEAPVVDVAAIAKEAADVAVKAYQAALEAEPPINDAGVLVTGDEADRALEGNPYEGVGEFLMDVKGAGMGNLDKRLLPLRGDAEDEAGFSMTKAVGSAIVGSIHGRKAVTGLSEGTPSGGGYFVDTDRNTSLMAQVYDTGYLLQNVRMFPVSAGSNGMTFYGEDETSRADGSRRGGVRAYWAAEAAEKTASQPKFREIELKLRKVIGLVYATDELLADASTIESYIMQVLPEELQFVVEDSIVNGSGAGQPLGILNSGALVSVAKETGQAAATIVSENIDAMWARMRPVNRQRAVWLVNQDVEPALATLNRAVGVGGQLVYVPPGGISAAPYAQLKARPVVATEYNATLGTVGDIMLCDLSQYYAIEKGGMQSASSIHVRFVYDESVYRFVLRIDGQPNIASPLTPFKGTDTLSPFVALADRA